MIISYFDKESNCVITIDSNCSEKNRLFVQKNLGEIDFLYEQALKILNGDVNKRYKTTFIKKHSVKKSKSDSNNSGKKLIKYRRIDEPDEELKKYMKDVVKCFQEKFNFLFPEYVCAYVKDRSIEQSVSQHTNSYAIAKFDIKNFFENCTFKKIMISLRSIYPFCLLDQHILETIIKACMIKYKNDYRLPQGAPSSPFLSNLAMLKLDFQINEYAKSKNIKYSRYSDDLFFSFTWRANKLTFKKLYETIKLKMHNLNYYFILNNEKTRFLKTKYGNVWMLGISIGNGNALKIGNKKKQLIKAKIWTFLKDLKDGKTWSRKEVQSLNGLVSHYKRIEPDFINNIIVKYEEKTGINYLESVKNIL